MQGTHSERLQPQQPNSSTPVCAQLSYHTVAQPLQDASNLPHTGSSAGLPRQYHSVYHSHPALNQQQSGSSAHEPADSCDLPYTDSIALLRGEPGTGASQQQSNSVAQHVRGAPQHVQQQHQDEQHTILVARQDDPEAEFGHELDMASNADEVHFLMLYRHPKCHHITTQTMLCQSLSSVFLSVALLRPACHASML